MRPVVPVVLGLSLLVASSAGAQAPAAPAPLARPGETGPAFLARNATDPAVKTLPSGLQYKVVRSGPAGGPSPKVGDVIKVHYEGSLLDGRVFDSTFQRGRAAIMPLDGLIPAWIEALPLMRVGDEWVIYAPPELGYGAEGVGPIPPAAVLSFRLQLMGMLSAD